MTLDSMPSIPISIGELVDKISILKIKSKNITDLTKSKNVNLELDVLKKRFENLNVSVFIKIEVKELENINKKLWVIEDNIREKEKRNEFDEGFVSLARSVYKVNDKRAQFKKIINEKTGSLFVEEKSYAN